MATLHYAAAHERLFSDEIERKNRVICIPSPLMIVFDAGTGCVTFIVWCASEVGEGCRI